MATSYHVFTTGPDAELSRARKDAAITAGEKLGVDFRVVTDSGKVVHQHTAEVEDLIGTTDEPVADEAPAAEEKPAKARKAKAKAKAKAEPKDEAPAAEPIDEAAVQAEVDEIGAAGSKAFDVAAVKRKIAKMLAKAERTDNEHERETFTAAAQKMMLRLGINQAELEASGEKKAEKIIEQRLDYASVYAMDLVKLGHAVCAGLGDLTTLQSGRWANASIFIIGHKTDVENAVKLIKSLELQVMSGLTAWQKANKEERKGLSNYDKLVGNRSYMRGFGHTVSTRLHAMRDEAVAEASTGAALVLASKMDRVTAAVSEMHPKLGKARNSRGARYSSLAMADGIKDGRKANLGEKAVGGDKKALDA